MEPSPVGELCSVGGRGRKCKAFFHRSVFSSHSLKCAFRGMCAVLGSFSPSTRKEQAAIRVVAVVSTAVSPWE